MVGMSEEICKPELGIAGTGRCRKETRAGQDQGAFERAILLNSALGRRNPLGDAEQKSGLLIILAKYSTIMLMSSSAQSALDPIDS
jgi:hypothetical protein